jgi:hypothetical protein
MAHSYLGIDLYGFPNTRDWKTILTTEQPTIGTLANPTVFETWHGCK